MNHPAVFEELDKKITAVSQSSAKAPAEFLEAELRRYINRDLVIFPRYCPSENSAASFSRDVEDWSKALDRSQERGSLREKLEREYQCYFKPDDIMKELQPAFWWKSTYAGCNAQIELFLLENGLGEVTGALWAEGLAKGIGQWEEKYFFGGAPDSPRDNLRRYLIGIGYLYPRAGGEVKVHPNLLFGQDGHSATYATMDSPFLTRDLIRCPYHEVLNSGWQDDNPLSDSELWCYWKDLVALSLAQLPEYILYTTGHLRGKDNHRNDVIAPALELGRKFVPQRYVELEPQIEKFEWHIPSGSEK